MDPVTVVAVDIGGTKIATGLVTLGDGEPPRVESVEKVPTEPLRGGPAIRDTVVEQVKAAIARSPHPVAGVGISTGGVVNPATGDITYANEMMPGWSGTTLGSDVTAATGLPCKVLNDVHAHALGEARWGGGKAYDSVVVVAVGTGISGAVVENGKLRLGRHDMASNVGHMACPQATGLPCTCGGVGHLEMVAAGPAIVEEYERLTGEAKGGAEVSQLAEQGDESAIAAEVRSAEALGTVLGSVANFQDPEAFILSGSVAECGPVWQDALRRAYQACAMQPVRKLPIENGSLGADAPLIGAAENFVCYGYED